MEKQSTKKNENTYENQPILNSSLKHFLDPSCSYIKKTDLDSHHKKKEKKKKAQKNISYKEIANITGYPEYHLKNMGKEKALGILNAHLYQKNGADLTAQVKNTFLEGMISIVNTLKDVQEDVKNLDSKEKIAFILKILETLSKY